MMPQLLNQNLFHRLPSALAASGFGAIGLLLLLTFSGTAAAETLRFQLTPGDRQAQAREDAPLDSIENGRITIHSVGITGFPATFPEFGITREHVREILTRHTADKNSRMTVSDMHRMADELTRYYREQGLAFAEFIISPQEIVSGHLEIHLMVSRLTGIHIKGNELYSGPQIVSYFDNQMMAPVYTPDIEKALERLNRLPGLNVFGIFSMGRQQGEAVLNLRAEEAPPRETTLRMDNHGLDNTGEFRAILRHREHNVLSSGGSLTLTAMTTEESSNLYGSVSYLQPLGLSSQFSASVSYNEFAVNNDFAALGLTGDLLDATLGWEYHLEHQAGRDSSLGLRVSSREASVSSEAFPELLDSDYRYINVAPYLELIQSLPGWRLKQSLRLSPVYGSVTDTSNTPGLDDYTLVKWRYALRHQWLSEWPEFQASLSISGQHTGDSLPPSERQPLAGPTSNKGFDTGLYSADSYYRTSFMQTLYRLQTDNQWQLVPYVFLDYSDGNKEGTGTSKAQFLSTGLGMEFSWRKSLQGGITWGYAIDSEITPDPGPLDSDTAVYGNLSIGF